MELLLRKYISSGDLFSYNESSGQYYTLDSMSLPSEKSGSVIYVDISSCSQLLPPQGAYDARLLLSDGRCIGCIAGIDEEFLSLSLPSSLSAIGGKGEDGNGSLQLDSLFLEKKR